MTNFVERNYENHVFSISYFTEVLEYNDRSPKRQFPKKEDNNKCSGFSLMDVFWRLVDGILETF